MASATIRFNATVRMVNGQTILELPEQASKKLPSRGQVAVHGTINGHTFQTVLEPDGEFGHWIRVDSGLQKATGLSSGDTATVQVEPTKEWPEPGVPRDLRRALSDAPRSIRDLWTAITPMARWEWVRWVNATKNPDTRERRIAVTLSKMSSGKRRPCCFNLAACTDPDLSTNGKLVDLRIGPKRAATKRRPAA
jgi:uncharacterized protein YdeI (YjbR/CyaY-like superfamily)